MLLTMLVALAGCLFGYAAWIIFINKKNASHETIEISLHDLAESIWLKHNEDDHHAKIADAMGIAELIKGGGKDKQPEKSLDVPECDGNNKSDRQQEASTTFIPVKADNDDSLKSFLNDCVYPHDDIIKNQGVMPLITNLIQIVEKHGHEPSVVTENGSDPEALDLGPVKNDLAKVSLKEHTYSVTRHLLAILKERIIDYRQNIPKALVAGLAHDIGKIPEYMHSADNKDHAHQDVSANKLAELLAGMELHWKMNVISAVRDHHADSKDQFTGSLKEADKKAREMELLRFAAGYSVKPFRQWFSIDDLFNHMMPDINVARDQGGSIRIFSHNGIIYAKPVYLYEITRVMMHDNSIIDLTFIYKSEYNTAMRYIVNTMKEAGFITEHVFQNRFSHSFEIRKFGGRNVKDSLTPIKPDKRFDMIEIEQRKIGDDIEDVRPLK